MKRIALLFAALLCLSACSVDKTAPVRYKVWYDWPERFLPDFSQLGEPDVEGVKRNLDLEDIVDTMNHFAALFETTLSVKSTEEYTFKVTTDDGSRFFIDDSLLIENDGAHRPIRKVTSVTLEKGKHDIRIEFFDFDKAQTRHFVYSTPTIAERPFNDRILKEQDALHVLRAPLRRRAEPPQIRHVGRKIRAHGDGECAQDDEKRKRTG